MSGRKPSIFGNRMENARTRPLLERAIELDPRMPLPMPNWPLSTGGIT